jgi:hypothetical protein
MCLSAQTGAARVGEDDRCTAACTCICVSQTQDHSIGPGTRDQLEQAVTSADPVVQRLYVALGILFAVIAALVAGILAYANGATIPGSVLYGGGAFGTAALVALAILDALRRP